MDQVNLTANDHIAGGQAVALVAEITAGIVLIIYLVKSRKSREISWRQVLWERDLRLILGASIEFLGRAIDIIAFLPVRPMLSDGLVLETAMYINSIAWLVSAASFLTFIGVIVMFWPWLHRLFGSGAIYVCTVGVGFLYLVAAILNSWVGSHL